MKRRLLVVTCLLGLLVCASCGRSSSDDEGNIFGTILVSAVDSALSPSIEFASLDSLSDFKSDIDLPRLKATNKLTSEQKKACMLIYSYLKSSAFSCSSLTDLLRQDGILNRDISVALDYVKVDWGTQAIKKAILLSSFDTLDYDILYGQLIENGFTEEEAERGAKFAYPRK